jgi:hypothetical protein
MVHSIKFSDKKREMQTGAVMAGDPIKKGCLNNQTAFFMKKRYY